MKTESIKDPQLYQLINGTFTPAQSSQILLSMVKSKMDFHNMEKHSNEERFGKDAALSQNRVKQLTELQSLLSERIKSAAHAGQNLRINGWIEITAVE